jgi:archaellum component FlaC
LATENILPERLAEMEHVLRAADETFNANLMICARSLLLQRVSASTDRDTEMKFLQGVFERIQQAGNRTELGDAASRASLLVARRGEKSMGEIFSTMADVLDRMTSSELYVFVENARGEPIHKDSSDGIVSYPTVGDLEQIASGLAERDRRSSETQTLSKVEKLETKETLVPSVAREKGKEPPRGPDHGRIDVQGLVNQLAASNLRVEEISKELLAAKNQLETFSKKFSESNDRLNGLQKELSILPKRLDEIEQTLTNIVRNAL